MTRPEFTWRIAYWRRTAPKFGQGAVVTLPLVFLVPLDTVFGSWMSASRIVLALGSLLLGAAIGRTTGLPRSSLVWLYQKGLSIRESVFRYWLVDLVIGVSIIVWWVVCWSVIAAVRGDGTIGDATAMLVGAIAGFTLMHALLFPISAAGRTNGVDLAILLLIASLLQPVLLSQDASNRAGLVAHLVLPPFSDAVGLGSALGDRQWLHVLDVGIHLSMFIWVCLAIAAWALGRWRPAR